MLDLQLFASTIKVDEPPPPPLENKEVSRNREIAKRVIDVICYLVTQQKFPRIGSRDKNSLEVEDCLENLHFLRDYDFLQTSLIDDGIEKIQKSPKIISDMIDAITSTVRKSIQKDLHHSTYVSVILSEHSTERTKSQISAVLRYLRNGEVCERFVGFTNIEGNKTTKMIYQLINKILNDFQIHRRTIAYSFDGFMLSSIQALYEVKQELKYCHPHIHFVPCHFHDLDDVLLRSLSYSSECDLFLKNIMSLDSFFQEGANLYLKFNDFEDDENPDDVSSHDSFKSRVTKRCGNYAAYLNTIKTHRLSIIDSFDKALLANENLTDCDVVKIKALRTFLAEFKNTFQLETFLRLFDLVAPLVEAFKSPVPGTAFDSNLMQCILKSFDDELNNRAVEMFWLRNVQDFHELNTEQKHLSAFFERKRNSCCKLYVEVTASMKNQIKYRFEDASKFSFCQILDLENSAKSLDPNHVKTLVANYGQVFDYALLDKEIKLVVGNKSAVNHDSVHGLYKFFVSSGLGSSFANLNRLCELVLTLPSTLPNAKRKSTRTKLDEINSWSYAANKQHSRDITFLCVEQDYLKELKRKKSFYDDVINEFRESSKTLELT